MAKTDKKSRLLTIVIVVVLGLWAAAMGAYFARDRVKSGPIFKAEPPSESTAGWDRERWLGVYQGRTKIGYAFSRLRAVPGGFELWSKTRIKLRLLDTAQNISLDLQGKLDPDYSMRSIAFEALTDFMQVRATGIREGNDFHLVIETGGEKIEHTLHFEKPPTMEMEWALSQAFKKATLGSEVSFSVFEPMSQKDMPVSVKVVGEEDIKIGDRTIPCWKAEVRMAEQLEYAWIARQDGEVMKEYHPGTGFTMLSEGREEALKVDWAKAGTVDVLVTLMVPSDAELADPRGLTRLKARLAGAPLDNLDMTAPGRQTVDGNTVEVQVEAAIPAVGYALPLTQSLPSAAAQFSAFLEPTPFIQSDQPKIREAAREAVGDAGDAVMATDRLADWVAKNVEPSLVVSIPSALEVLDKKKGACKEHAVLFVALARSLGIPARIVSGIVYSEQMALPGFYYHAWSEVWLADAQGRGSWVAVDPTFNQNPADATHIKLVEGDLDQMLKLMQVIGRIKVEVEDYR